MKRAILALALLGSPAFASSPGQPLDCSDWVIHDPSLRCVTEREPAFGTDADDPMVNRGTNRVTDNDGRSLVLKYPLVGIVAYHGNAETVLATLPDRRQRPDGISYDRAAPVEYRNGIQYPGHESELPRLDGLVSFDAVRGRLLVSMRRWIERDNAPASTYPYPTPQYYVLAFEGFTTLFEIMQTYTPAGALTARVPVHPEGFPAADHFDTYTGHLTRPLDLSAADPVQCGFPAHPPQPGDQLSLPDIPRPSPGHASFVLTTVSYGGAHRAGRTVNAAGVMVGRDPNMLPPCIVERRRP